MIMGMENRIKPRVFVIDDDPEIQILLNKVFTLENYDVDLFSNARDALTQLQKRQKTVEKCDLIVCDLKLPGINGLEFLDLLLKDGLEIPIIFVTAHASVETAVEALKKGAFDYVVKPIHLSELRIIAARAFELQKLKEERSLLQKKLDEQVTRNGSFGQMIGKSQKLQNIFDLIKRVARSNSNVLITGESGTGKELVARSIHEKSERRHQPFIPINCSAIPDQLLESELFGHKKGAFTGASESRKGLFEEAQKGTVFLDEIGDMPLGLQAKLLRVLQERKIRSIGENFLKEIDIRIIAATHKNIRTLIQDGKFREDLYYRISVIPIQLPPLRERREDIPLMVDYFLKKYCELNHTPLKKLTHAALAKLLRMHLPGNVRELENMLERAVVLCEKEWLDEPDLETENTENHNLPLQGLFTQLPSLEDLERTYIRYILEVTHDGKEKASEILGINRKTLYRKMLRN